MKVIDLLNKIANGEEIPKKVRYKEKEWGYEEIIQDYIFIRNDLSNYFLLQEMFVECDGIKELLFYEIEIIEDVEEDKEIKKINTNIPCAYEIESTLRDKLNEVIDVVNKLNKKN